ncbi:hypothetical protein [Brevibacillus brevis]|uniref:hypothetical protein n=1 Tax=Brevibacillus brevis TaxID=1393 RepID=UPI0037C5B86D
MYLERATIKINNVNWKLVGTVVAEKDSKLGYEFLRRLAQFFKAEQLEPMPPVFANVAKLLGDMGGEIQISLYCNLEAVEFLNKNVYIQRIFEYYLQLAKYADKYPDTSQYLSIYEPLIKVFERGGSFTIKPLALEIKNIAHFPLNDWYTRFVEKEPIEINDL